MLASKNPEHEFFHKDYNPESSAVKVVKARKIIDNSDGLFDNLPKAPKSGKKRRSHICIDSIVSDYNSEKLKYEKYKENKNKWKLKMR